MASLQVFNGTLVPVPAAASTLLSAFHGSGIRASFGPAGFLISYLAGECALIWTPGVLPVLQVLFTTTLADSCPLAWVKRHHAVQQQQLHCPAVSDAIYRIH